MSEHPVEPPGKVYHASGSLEEFRAVIYFAQTALKIPILINGGAAIAILALMGNTWSENSITTDLAGSLLFFSIGVFMAAISTGISYLTQYLFQTYENKEDFKKAQKLQLTTIILVVISYILFMFGAWWSYDTFSDSKKPPSTSCICGEV